MPIGVNEGALGSEGSGELRRYLGYPESFSQSGGSRVIYLSFLRSGIKFSLGHGISFPCTEESVKSCSVVAVVKVPYIDKSPFLL